MDGLGGGLGHGLGEGRTRQDGLGKGRTRRGGLDRQDRGTGSRREISPQAGTKLSCGEQKQRGEAPLFMLSTDANRQEHDIIRQHSTNHSNDNRHPTWPPRPPRPPRLRPHTHHTSKQSLWQHQDRKKERDETRKRREEAPEFPPKEHSHTPQQDLQEIKERQGEGRRER